MTDAQKRAKKKWIEKNQEKVREKNRQSSKRYYEKHKDRASEYYQKTKHLRGRVYADRSRIAGLKRRFGISTEDYNRMLDSQDHCCAICGTGDGTGSSHQSKRLAVDHCHTTGKVRQLLCSKCNLGIGYFDDNADRLSLAIQYLERHQ